MIRLRDTFAFILIALLCFLDFSVGLALVPRQPTRIDNIPSELLERAVASSSAPADTNSTVFSPDAYPKIAAFFYGGGQFFTLMVAEGIQQKCQTAKDGSMTKTQCGLRIAEVVTLAVMTITGTEYVYHHGFAPPTGPGVGKRAPNSDCESYTFLDALWDRSEPLFEVDDLIEGHTVTIAQAESYTDEDDVENRFFSIRTREHETNETHEGLLHHQPADGFHAIGMNNVFDDFDLEKRDFPADHITGYYAWIHSNQAILNSLDHQKKISKTLASSVYDRIYKYARRETCASIEVISNEGQEYEVNKGVFAILNGKARRDFIKGLKQAIWDKDCGTRS